MADFDRYLAACEDRDADRRLAGDGEPEKADEGIIECLERLARKAERRLEMYRDREMEDRS